MMTFILKGLTTRCKKSTKQEIELGEFSQFPERAFLSYVFASGFPNRYFLKILKSFSLLSLRTLRSEDGDGSENVVENIEGCPILSTRIQSYHLAFHRKTGSLVV